VGLCLLWVVSSDARVSRTRQSSPLAGNSDPQGMLYFNECVGLRSEGE
jgi:hypothetical protein